MELIYRGLQKSDWENEGLFEIGCKSLLCEEISEKNLIFPFLGIHMPNLTLDRK